MTTIIGNIVKSFRFVGSPSSDIENITNTPTNFSSANLTDYNASSNGDQSPEDLFKECVGVAGKSLCDFLFKK